MSSDVQTQFLVVGAGPAGLGLASFLGQHGRYSMDVIEELCDTHPDVYRSRGACYFQGLWYRGHPQGSFIQSVRFRYVAQERGPSSYCLTRCIVECLRDLGIEHEALQQSVRGRSFQSMRWSRSMIGEEYGKVLGWAEHPSCIVGLPFPSPFNRSKLSL